MLYIQMKYGINASYLASSSSISVSKAEQEKVGNLFTTPEKYRAWSKEDLIDLLSALNDMPKGLFPLGRDIRIKRSKAENLPDSDYVDRSHALGFTTPSGLLNNGRKDVFLVESPLFDQTRLGVKYTIFHELAHTVGRDFELTDPWLKAAHWKIDKNGEYSLTNKKCATSAYGGSDPLEDFAESMVTYRYNAASLKENCPSKYNYLKEKIFHGQEYISKDSCRNP